MKRYELNPYGFKLWVTAAPSDINKFTTRDGSSLIYGNDRGLATTYSVVCKYLPNFLGYLVLINKEVLLAWHYGTINYLPRLCNIAAHEANHVVTETFADCDIIINEDSQETEAYYQGYVTQCIMDYIIKEVIFIEDEKDRKAGKILCT